MSPQNTPTSSQAPSRSAGPRRDDRRHFRGRGPRGPRPPGASVPQGAPHIKEFTGADGKKLKIIVLGGLEEVGRNCTLVEYENDIIFIDMGLQFPEEDQPGVDYIIPNMSYVRGKEKNIRGVIITHGHYDHIGAIPHVVPRIGNPPVFGLPMTAGIIKKRQEDFEGVKINIREVKIDDRLVLGNFQVEFVHINHSIPDAVAVVVHTPVGTIIHTGDWKFDYTPIGAPPADFIKLASLGARGVLALMGDSTNAAHAGHQISEREIANTLRLILEKAQGRVIVGTFASLLGRVRQIFDIAQDLGKKVALDGYSMKTNVEIARVLKYINIKPGTLIDIAQINDYPKDKVVVVCTGAQGEERASLMRIANDEHRSVRIQPADTVIFSSSVIPGNERTVQRLKDTLYRKGADVIHYQMMDVHAGGHAMKEDIKLMLLLLKPKYYIPIEGNHFLLRENAKVAAMMGIPKENIFVADNGQVMEFVAGGKGRLSDVKVMADYVFVDGLGVGDISEVVLRDRQALAEDGMVVVVAPVAKRTGGLAGNLEIVSHGFVQVEHNQALIDELKKHVEKILIDKDTKSEADPDDIKRKIRDDVGAFLFTKTQRRPMILPVIIEV
ncbi:ribonuclease J [Patescibacteria group bacterium]|nr:MAG: ribonuclease J [Patescibacteria group bacterium]